MGLQDILGSWDKVLEALEERGCFNGKRVDIVGELNVELCGLGLRVNGSYVQGVGCLDFQDYTFYSLRPHILTVLNLCQRAGNVAFVRIAASKS